MSTADWATTIAAVTPAIVSMRVSQVRSFDGAAANYSYATGFVVDAARGIIVSNRHVVTSGPVRAEAVFSDHEEVPVTALYRDPVHDFGFFRYDPSAVRYLRVPSIPLAPQSARVGLEVRVVGNDAGEKLSILSGTLARLDRAAPVYGTAMADYNDANTFYLAAASSTSGGSSGSPVLAVDGTAVAINAGGKRSAASSFYLPLDRVVRALRLVQDGLLPPPRGDLQAVFAHEAFDEARRLGLSGAAEAGVRSTFPRETGVLVVEQVLAGGPSDPGRGRHWAAARAKRAAASAVTGGVGGGGSTGSAAGDATAGTTPTHAAPRTAGDAAAAAAGDAGADAEPPYSATVTLLRSGDGDADGSCGDDDGVAAASLHARGSTASARLDAATGSSGGGATACAPGFDGTATGGGEEETTHGGSTPPPAGSGSGGAAAPVAALGLEPGDVLLSLNGVPLTHFIPLEESLDNTAAVAAAYANAAVALGLGDDVAALLLQPQPPVASPTAASGNAAPSSSPSPADDAVGADREIALTWLRRAAAVAGSGFGGSAPGGEAAVSGRLWSRRASRAASAAAAAAGGGGASLTLPAAPPDGRDDVTALPTEGALPLPPQAVLTGAVPPPITTVGLARQPSAVSSSLSTGGGTPASGAAVATSGAHYLFSPSAGALPHAGAVASMALTGPQATSVGGPGTPLAVAASAGPTAAQQQRRLAPGGGAPLLPSSSLARAVQMSPTSQLPPPAVSSAGSAAAGAASAGSAGGGAPIFHGGISEDQAMLTGTMPLPLAPGDDGGVALAEAPAAALSSVPPPGDGSGGAGDIDMAGSGCTTSRAGGVTDSTTAAVAAAAGECRGLLGREAVPLPTPPAPAPPSAAQTAAQSRLFFAQPSDAITATTANGAVAQPFLPHEALAGIADIGRRVGGDASSSGSGGVTSGGAHVAAFLSAVRRCFGDEPPAQQQHDGGVPLLAGSAPASASPTSTGPHFHGMQVMPRHLPSVAVCEHAAMHAAAQAAAGGSGAHAAAASAAVHAHTHTLPVPAVAGLADALRRLHALLATYVDGVAAAHGKPAAAAEAGSAAAAAATTTTARGSPQPGVATSTVVPSPLAAVGHGPAPAPVPVPYPDASGSGGGGGGDDEAMAEEARGSDTSTPLHPTAAAALSTARAAVARGFVGVLLACRLELGLERGGSRVARSVAVCDHHAGLPSAFLEVSGGLLHGASWMAARNNSVPLGGCYVSQTGYMLSRADVPQHALIVAVGRVPTPDLPALEAALTALPDGAKVPLRYTVLGDAHRERVAVLTFDRRWFEMGHWSRNDVTGTWNHRPCLPAPPPQRLLPATASFPRLAGVSPAAERAWRSLALCECQIPVLADGVHSSSFIGCAVVVDAARGLAVVDRNTVPVACCDVQLTFAGSLEVPASVAFLHPHHNYALIAYDPALLGATPVEGLPLSDAPLGVGASIEFVGLTSTNNPIVQTCVVTKVERVGVGDGSPPRYRAYNHDSLHFDRVAPCLGGVFLDPATGAVGALWASYSYSTSSGDAREMSLGLPAALVADAAAPLMSGRAPAIPSLDTELRPLPLSKARTGMGLPPGWVAQLERLGGDRRTVLCVRRCAPRSPASGALREGDLLLAVAGAPVITFRDVETALARAYAAQLQQHAQAAGGAAESSAPPPPPRAVPVTIVRDGAELVVDVAPTLLSGRGTERLLCWAGILLQEAHPPVTDRGFVPEVAGGTGEPGAAVGSPPYCSRWSFGSPAHKGGIRATNWIVEVNGVPTPSLDALLGVVSALGDGADARLKCVDLADRKRVYTLRTDEHYWPTVELRLEPAAGGSSGGGGGSSAGHRWSLIRHLPGAAAAAAATVTLAPPS